MPDEIQAVAALADPVRRRLYELIADRDQPVSREEAATALDIPTHSARFHLDRLVEDGLLEVEFRRLSGRTGPGAGRPSKLYTRSTRPIAVSLPRRNYDLVGSILAAAVERSLSGETLPEALTDVARNRGRAIGAAHEPDPDEPVAGGELERTARALADEGFEPMVTDAELLLRNCPFDSLARDHTALVCGVNLGFVGGLIDGLGCTGVEARLAPAPGRCCVVARSTGDRS